jgi:hypothetical protein
MTRYELESRQVPDMLDCRRAHTDDEYSTPSTQASTQILQRFPCRFHPMTKLFSLLRRTDTTGRRAILDYLSTVRSRENLFDHISGLRE